MILSHVFYTVFQSFPPLGMELLAAFSSLAHFPTSLLMAPGISSQINYLHLNPYLWICFSGNLNLRQACDDHIGPNPGDCCSSPLPHSRKFWGPLSSLWQPSIKIMGQGGKNWDNPSSSTPVALSGPLGTFGECDSEVDVLHWSRYNCFLLYQMGTFSTFLEPLHMEIE